jgi:hypothetical protein
MTTLSAPPVVPVHQPATPGGGTHEHLLAFELGDFDPPNWAQLRDPRGGVHLNIQGERWYQPPTWPERPGELTKMLQFEIEVDDLESAVATAIAAGGAEADWRPPNRDPDRIRIILDPAGHPVCLFVRGD